eukprot:TRINITY_DN1289_c0_g1_i1.p2 TRINITY_DN1289_c0_g1~~TRINITY_DN1289_c0_g1_i1.p2  ORF type:complete len:419 (-),score=70.17 TRINITY_DN1289_c0_g1_i1:1939-3195(-)
MLAALFFVIIPLSTIIWRNVHAKSSIDEIWVAPGFEASLWASSLNRPRSILPTTNGDFIVVSHSGEVYALWDDDENGQCDNDERVVIASTGGSGHGLFIFNGSLYASSATQVFRWSYKVGSRKYLGFPDVVIHSMPSGGHGTRTLVIDENGRLFVSIGSGENVDDNESRAKIIQVDVNKVPTNGYDYNQCKVWASGLRNEVGLAVDKYGTLWGVENGVDSLEREDFGDIHENNPSEEVNRFYESDMFFGYPYCWSEYILPSQYARGAGTQWAHPKFMSDGVHNDSWCQNIQNVQPPVYNLPAHTAPLSMMFYYGKSFPDVYRGGAFVTLHGSWNRKVPQGYKVVYLKYKENRPVEHVDFIKHIGELEYWSTDMRPVGLAINIPKGEHFRTNETLSHMDCLYVTSDASGEIIRVCPTSL